MSIDLEYAIKKDIRNNPVIREIDARERLDLRRTIWLAVLSVAVLLFAAWQSSELRTAGIRIEGLRQHLAYERTTNRQLRLNLERLRSPQLLEHRAMRELQMVAPTSAETLILERVPVTSPRAGVVAQVH
jgi:hypothetical protein